MSNTYLYIELYLYKGMYMLSSRTQSTLDEVALARKVKQSLNALSPFLALPITPATARDYVDVLKKHDILYYFEEDANNVVIYDTNSRGVDRETSFTSRQATMLNVIRNRFMEDDESFKTLFNTVWCADDSGLERDDERASELISDAFDIVDRICVR